LNPRLLPFLKDNDGFIWIGTYVDGLYRYDGKNLKHYDKNSGFISSANVPAILQDRDNTLWFISNGSGLVSYDKETNKTFQYSPDPGNPKSISSTSFYWEGKNIIMEDDKGFIWIGTIGGGLNKLNKNTGEFTHFRHQPDNPRSISSDNIRSVYQDSKGRIWVGTELGLNLLSENGRDFTRFIHDPENSSSISDNIVMSLFEDSDGTLWLGTESNGADYLNADGKTFTNLRFQMKHDRGLAANFTNHISQDSQGNIWFCHQAHSTIYNKNTDQFYHVQGAYRDSTKIFHDKEHEVIWNLTDSGRLCIYNPEANRFKLYRPIPGNPDSISSEIVITIYEDSRKELWIATLGGLNRYNRKTGKFQVYMHEPGNPKTIPSTSDYSPGIFEDSEGKFWVGSAVPASLSLFDREKGEVIKSYMHNPADPESLPDAQQINHIIEDRNDSNIFWMGTFKGLVKFDKRTEKFTTFGSQTHWNLYQDDEGIVWATTWGEGLARFDPKTTQFSYYRNDKDDPETVSDNLQVTLFVDSKNRMWIGTENGLNLFDRKTGKCIRFTRQEGFPFDAIHSMGEDRANHLWLATTSGLLWFDPDQKKYRVFTPDDGIQGWVFYANNGIMTENGEMWFGGTKGMNSFFPSEIKVNQNIPEIKLTSLRQGGQEVDFGKAAEWLKEINLDWQQNYFEFEFVAMDYTNPRKNLYAYKLEGVDPDWFQAGHQNSGRYSGLKPGEYTLRLKGSNNDGIWNEDGISILVKVSPPFWETWWFYSLMAMLPVIFVCIIILYLYRLNREIDERKNAENKLKESNEKLEEYNERLQRLDRLKDDFMANTSHELRTPMTGIIGLAESMLQGSTGKLPDKTMTNLSMIVSSGKRLSNLINDILDFSKLRHKDLQLSLKEVDFHSLAGVTIAISEPIARAKPLILKNDIPESAPLVKGDENRLQQILFNLLGNAIKFTEKGVISISSREVDGFLEISVTDQGIGIPKERHKDIFKSFEQVDGSIERKYGGTGLGLAVSKDLVELHNGKIDLESTPGQGSRFFFTLPIAENQTREEQTAGQIASFQVVDMASDDLPIVKSFESLDLSKWANDKVKVLVVDDETINLQVVADQLSLKNYEVTLVSNGNDALEMITELEKQNKSFDLILLDIMMPGLSGYDVCRKLREKFPAEKLPVIMLTAKNRPEDLVAGFEAGASDYLPKPFSNKELLARIENQYDLKRMTDQHFDDMEALKESELKYIRLFKERKEVAEELGNLKSYLANIIDSMPSLIIGVDTQGNITQWNNESEKRTGINAREALGNPLLSVMPRLAPVLDLVERAIENQTEKTLARQPRFVDNIRRFEDFTVYPLADGAEGAVIRIDDVTEQVRLEEMMIQNEKMLSVGGLAAGMAHEINNPLGGMMQTANVVTDRLTNPDLPNNIKAAREVGTDMQTISAFMHSRKVIAMLSQIRESGKRAAEIVKNMLSFARKSDSTFSTHSPAELLDKSVELASSDYNLKKHFDFRKIKITRDYQKTTPLPCDSSKIQQVILNILRNGAEAMQEAGVENPEFVLRLMKDEEENMIRVEIEDNGPGMAEEVRKRVFEPFYTTKTTDKGTGLGLSVSYFIITENHKGKMSVESSPGNGARFILKLPTEIEV
jgi:PAS domain S-box-containing protein